MFGRKKEVKKKSYTKLVMLKDGLPNFTNDTCIELIVDEPNNCIVFSDANKKDGKSATLNFEKIINLELGEKGSTLADNSTGGAVIGAVIAGTTGAIIGSTTGKKSSNIPTLKIKYQSGSEEKEINLYQCNYYSDGSIQLVKSLIDKNIIKRNEIENHIDL